MSVNTWISNQRKKRMRQIRSCFQLKISKTFRWTNKKRRSVSPRCVGGEHDVIAIDAALKYETLAKMRLDRAKANVEAAAKELKEAERGVEDAKKYTKSVKSYCKKSQANQANASDYVFVSPASKTKTSKVAVDVKEDSTCASKGDES